MSASTYYIRAQAWTAPAAWLLAALAGAVALGLWQPHALVIVLALLAGPHLWQRGTIFTGDPEVRQGELLPNFPALNKIQQDKELFRVFSFSDYLLEPEILGTYGVEDFRTADAIDVLEHIYYTRTLIHYPLSQGKPELARKFLALANVKYLLERPRTRVPDFAKEVYRGELNVYQVPARPRAAFYEKTEFIQASEFSDWPTAHKSGLPRLWAMLQQGLDPEKTLLLNDIPEDAAASSNADSGANQGPAEVSIVSHSPHEVIIDVKAPRPGYIFLADTHFPGWKASVDGHAVALLRAWLMFRAVRVGAGQHRVTFQYRPASLRLGAWVTGLSLLLLLVLWALDLKKNGLSSGFFAPAELLLMANVLWGALYWGWWLGLVSR